MPYIKRLKKGGLPSLQGDSAYEYIEVDDYGNPVERNNFNKEMSNTKKFLSKTEAKIGKGMRAPDTAKGYKTPFNYELWNKLRKNKKVR